MSTLSYVQEIGFGDPTPPPPVNQPHSFFAAAQAVSAFMPPHQGSGAYPPPSKSAICYLCDICVYIEDYKECLQQIS